jgi:hypothetical protein
VVDDTQASRVVSETLTDGLEYHTYGADDKEIYCDDRPGVKNKPTDNETDKLH